MLDGATGDTTMTTETPSAGGFSSVGVVGDMDGDALQDVVVASGATAGVSVTAYAGTDGRPLWNRMVDAEFVFGVVQGGDLNGDGTTDVLLAGFDPEAFGGTVDAVSGADGAALWAADGEIAVGVGDVDGDGTDDVILQRIFDNFDTGRMGVRYVLRRGDGTKIFGRSHGLRMSQGSSMTDHRLVWHGRRRERRSSPGSRS